MAGTSKKSKVVALRLPNEIVEKIERRANKLGRSVHDYLRDRVVYDVNRPH